MTSDAVAGPADFGDVPGRLELSAPADPQILDLIHALLEQLWTGNPEVSDVDRFRFETAVIEVLGNIVEHAYQLDPAAAEHRDHARRFIVVLAVTAQEVVASFGDNGLPTSLDLSNVAMPHADAESGRGLALAAATTDELSYARVDGRNHWKLRCTRSGN
jgi:serine/threonine-protein kinase RsbW